jgi:hypothetical protein
MNERQAIIIALIIIGIAFLWIAANKPTQITEYDARNFVRNDAQSKYPEADIEVISTNNSGGSWKMKVRATLNASSPCPTRIHLYYDYPAMQFATRPPEYITRDCKVCVNVQECVILFPEEALIASHTFPGTDDIGGFLSRNQNAVGMAEEKASYKDYTNVWFVQWNTDSAAGSYSIYMDDRGKVLDISFTPPASPSPN